MREKQTTHVETSLFLICSRIVSYYNNIIIIMVDSIYALRFLSQCETRFTLKTKKKTFR